MKRQSIITAGMLVLVAGCAAQRSRPPSATEWNELVSPHFRLRTNLPEPAAVQASRELERLRSALLAGAFRMEVDPPGRLQAVLFRDAEGLVEFVDSRVDGYVTSTPSGPLLVSSGLDVQSESGGAGRAKILHELTHYLSSFVLLRQPRWFAEGMAEYLEALSASGQTVRLGGPHPDNVRILQKKGVLPMSELWVAESASERAFSSHFYASAWLWFHFLTDRYPARLSAFEQMLRRAEDPPESFATAFSSTRMEVLEDELQKYLSAQRFAVRVEQVRAQPAAAEIRSLSPADLHAMRAELFLDSPARRTPAERKELAKWELDRALKNDPHHVEATVMRAAYLKPEKRLDVARELVRARPKDGRAWTFLASEMENDPTSRQERAGALELAARLSPDDAVALNNLAWEKVTRGEPAVGLELAERAVRIAPWSPAMLDTYASALFKVGRCPEALTVQQRAVDLLHEEVSLATREELLAALNQYRARCAR